MKFLFAVMFLALTSTAATASDSCQEEESKQHCYVWIGDKDGNFVDRKNVEFSVKSGTFLCDGRPNESFQWEGNVDSKVVAKINADWTSYNLSLFDVKDTERSRPLGSGSFKRSGIWGDYLGFSINTPDGEYTIACASMDE